MNGTGIRMRTRSLETVLFVMILWGTVGLPVTRAWADESDDFSESLRERLATTERRAICGLNCVYGFLRLHGSSVAYDELEEKLGTSTAGCSFLDLRRVCQRFGKSAKVARCDIDSFESIELPIIVYNPESTVEPGSEGSDMGHFVLLLKVEGEQAWYMDGTSCKVERVRLEWFKEKIATEMVLQIDRRPYRRWEVLSAVLSSLLLVGLIGWKMREK